MSSANQWPSRPAASDVSGPLRPPATINIRGYGDIPAVASFCLEALDGAVDLVRADGGEVAALDYAGAALVTRARRQRPPRPPGFGAASRSSQPMSQPGPFDPNDPIDSQVTQVMPSAQLARAYGPDQGLIGKVWRRREPLVVRLDPKAPDIARELLIEPDAPHHLAVPIYRPDTLNHVGGRGPVIGVLRVFNRDEMWSYSAHDRLLLELQADRLGRALAVLNPSDDTVRRGDLINALRELSGVGPTRGELFSRVAQIAVRQLNALTFTALLQTPGSAEAQTELALRAGVPQAGGRFALAEAPVWLQRALSGEVVNERAPAGGSASLLASLGWSQEPAVRSALAAPLLAGGRPVGAIVVTSPQPDAFTADAGALFEALALATSTFAENARLVEDAARSVGQLHEQRRQLSALNNAVQTLNASLDVNTTLQALAEQATQLTSAQVCAVFLRDEPGSALVCRSVYPPEREREAPLLEAHIPLAWRNIGQRLSEGTFVQEDDLSKESDDPDSATVKLARVGVTAFLATPIVQQDKQLGALVIYSPNRAQRFSAVEIGLLQGLSSQAAIAINNARLYAELEDAYEQLKALDKVKDDFILTVSHEFRTPLTAIEGYVTLINKHGHKLDQEKLQQFATEIHQATVQLAGMISMLADANRMSSQPLRIAPRPVNLLAIATDVLGVQLPEARERIDMKIADDLWVNGDDERLPRVFSNLITNAIKYSGAGKACHVSARVASYQELTAAGRKLTVSEDANPTWVVVTVEDDGPGISPEDQTRLFQKFVRLSQSLVTPVRGTGLGLWICRQYVDAMGGDIWVESRVGQGARFSFCLPRISAPAS